MSGIESGHCVEVIFIRHAESEGNIRENHCCAVLRALKSFTVPSYGETVEALKLHEFNLNTRLSALGKRQAADMHMILKQEDLWKTFNAELCVYSPLDRTKETCLTIVPKEYHDKCIPLPCLMEVTPLEHLLKFYLQAKIQSFEDWLQVAPVKRLVVVGHSQYFNKLLKLKQLMRNCDVFRATATFSPAAGTSITGIVCNWSEPVLLHHTDLAEPHPIDDLFSWPTITNKTSNNNGSTRTGTSSDEDGNGDLDNNLPEEPTYRICQATQSEDPSKKLIRPCRCTGSQSHVHLHCLNTWRNTSNTAYFTCSVCKYNYEFRRSALAELTTREEFVVLVAVLMILTCILLAGAVVTLLVERLDLPLNIPGYIYHITDTVHYWRVCKAQHMQPLSEVLYAIYKHSSGVREMFALLTNFLRSPLPMRAFLCHPGVATAIDVLVTGAALVGSVGFLAHFYSQIRQLRNFGGAHWLQYAVVTGMWFSSLGNTAAGRIWLVVGCAIATREIYSVLTVHARRLSHWLGDVILEPAAGSAGGATSAAGA